MNKILEWYTKLHRFWQMAVGALLAAALIHLAAGSFPVLGLAIAVAGAALAATRWAALGWGAMAFGLLSFLILVGGCSGPIEHHHTVEGIPSLRVPSQPDPQPGTGGSPGYEVDRLDSVSDVDPRVHGNDDVDGPRRRYVNGVERSAPGPDPAVPRWVKCAFAPSRCD